jgi:hypothetical protein
MSGCFSHCTGLCTFCIFSKCQFHLFRNVVSLGSLMPKISLYYACLRVRIVPWGSFSLFIRARRVCHTVRMSVCQFSSLVNANWILVVSFCILFNTCKRESINWKMQLLHCYPSICYPQAVESRKAARARQLKAKQNIFGAHPTKHQRKGACPMPLLKRQLGHASSFNVSLSLGAHLRSNRQYNNEAQW